MNRFIIRLFLLLILPIVFANAQNTTQPEQGGKPVLPYFPSLNPASMDRSVDPCVDFYHYSCGGWQKHNPIPPDQTSWDVYGKLYQDNLDFLRGMLEQAATAKAPRDAATQKTGDFFASCMDESVIEKQGLSSLKGDLAAIEDLSAVGEIARLLASLQLAYGGSMLFRPGSMQDLDDSERVVAELDQGGLGCRIVITTPRKMTNRKRFAIAMCSTCRRCSN